MTPLLAHIGNVPVEEWLPFLVPVVALFVYGRRKDRRRAAAVRELPDVDHGLDPAAVESVLREWAKSKREHLSPTLLPVLYPPGPDGLTAAELADRTGLGPATVRDLLEQLEDLGYVDLDMAGDPQGPRASLTFEGYDLVYETEAALLQHASVQPPAAVEPRPAGSTRSG
jgi:DNA-binding transcriptional ArsR family regulator